MDGVNTRVDSPRAGNNNHDYKNNMIIEQIMLRYRPIAPRPETAPSSGYSSPAKDFKRTRVKRKYVRVKKTKKSKNTSELTVNDNKTWFDLDTTVAMIEESVSVTDPLQNLSNWISFDVPGSTRKDTLINNNNNNNNDNNNNSNNLFEAEPLEMMKLSPDLHGVDLATAVQQRKVIESWITVESVTGTCEDQRLLGYTDDEIWNNLDHDSCPCFVSNGYDEVLWVNPAYRTMLDLNSNGEIQATELAVWLKVKVDKSTVVKYLPAFSCRVRIEYRLSEKKRRMTVPCDVCRMNSGEFAWRLDVKFALSLGLALN